MNAPDRAFNSGIRRGVAQVALTLSNNAVSPLGGTVRRGLPQGFLFNVEVYDVLTARISKCEGE
jgi:hypothetical protein